MLPLIRNVLFATIAVIALIVALANMGMNVTPLLAGAGVIGLAIGFGAQSLVADLITGLFIIIEDSLSIDDYVDVGGHLGTVEGPDYPYRAPARPGRRGAYHPVQRDQEHQNYSRQFGYAMFRWPVPASMPIDDAVALVREVAMELRSDRRSTATCGRRWNCGAWSFDNGQAILRFRFKTAPIKQWEGPAGVQPAPASAPRPGRPRTVHAASQRTLSRAPGEIRGTGRAGHAGGRRHLARQDDPADAAHVAVVDAVALPRRTRYHGPALAAHVAAVDVVAALAVAADDGAALAARVAVADVVAVVALSRRQQRAVTPHVAAVDVAAIPAVAAFQCVAHAPQVAVVDIAAFGAGLGGQAEDGGKQEPESDAWTVLILGAGSAASLTERRGELCVSPWAGP